MDDLRLPTAAVMIHHMDLSDRITIDPAICHGKPCVRGLRYPVGFLLDLLGAGMTPDVWRRPSRSVAGEGTRT